YHIPRKYPIRNPFKPLRLVLIVAWLLVLLHNARSILTRGYSCPLKPRYRIRYAHTSVSKGATATQCFCSPAGRSGYTGCHTFCKSTALPLLQCSFHSLRLLPTLILRDNNILRSVPFTPHRCITARA